MRPFVEDSMRLDDLCVRLIGLGVVCECPQTQEHILSGIRIRILCKTPFGICNVHLYPKEKSNHKTSKFQVHVNCLVIEKHI